MRYIIKNNTFLNYSLWGIIFSCCLLSACDQSATQTQSVDYSYVVSDTASVNIEGLWINDLDDNYAINDSSMYENLRLFKLREADSCILPSLDFKQYTLLGLSLFSGGCKMPTILREIRRDDTLKTVTYKVDVTSHGDCMKLFTDMNWMRVPKIPAQYTIHYTLNITHN